MDGREFLSTGQIARVLRVTRVTVYRWARAGKLKAHKTPGGTYRVARGDFEAFLRRAGIGDLAGNHLPQATARVLVVDDEPDVAGERRREGMTGEILETEGEKGDLFDGRRDGPVTDQDLARREALYRLFVNSTADMAFLKDPQFRYVIVNRNLVDFFGKKEEEEVVGRTDTDLMPEAAAAACRRTDVQALGSDGVVVSTERSGGRLFETRKFPVPFGGNRVGVGGYIRDVTGSRQTEQDLRESLDRMRSMAEGIIHAISRIGEIRDPYTSGHERRVARLASAVALKMGMTEERAEGVAVAAALHDIGKIAVPAEILSKPGRINDYEFSMIKTHPLVGYQILKEIEFPKHWPVALCALQHQERMDGSGYPEGLPAEKIIPEARIIAVADVIEAMSSHRPYRPALGIEKALEEVTANRGILYDPGVVDACLGLFKKGFKFD